MSEARQLCPQVEGAILTNFAPPEGGMLYPPPIMAV